MVIILDREMIANLRRQNKRLHEAGDELIDYARGCGSPDAHAAVERWEQAKKEEP